MFQNPLSVWMRVAALYAAFTLPAAAQGSAAGLADDTADLEALLNQPVYAASKFTQDAAGAPAAVTVITAGDIRAQGWRTLSEALGGVRGVYLRNDRFYDYVGVRGFARPGGFSSRLLVLIDGMRVNDNIYDQAGAGQEFPLDIELIERIEFIPGPGSALYGSNAVLGVVNIITKSAASLAGGALSVELGSSGGRALGLTLGRELGDARLVVAVRSAVKAGSDLYYPEFDAADTNFGITRDADRQTDRKLYAKWTQGDLTATALVSQRRKRIPTGAFLTVFPSTETHGDDSYGFLDLRWQRELDADSQLFVRTTLGQYDFRGGFDYGPIDGVQHLDQRGRWLGMEARWLYTGWARQRVVLGVEAQRNFKQDQRAYFGTGSGAGELLADIHAGTQRWGLFAQDELTLHPDLRAVLGARVDRQLNGDTTATPRLALMWDAAPGLVLKLLDGRAYREPNAYESQYHDNIALANPELRSETLRASELALDWRVQANLRLAASLYRYKVNDLIEQQDQLIGAQNWLIYNNAGSVNARGLELEADYVAASGWRLRGSWASQRARNVEGGEQIGNSPTTLSKLNLSLPVPLPFWQGQGRQGQGRVGLEWQRMGHRRTVLGASLPAHAVTNLSFQVAPAGSRLSLSASVYNLFDTDYADPGGTEHVQDTLARDGRQWRVQMAWQF